MISKNSTTFSLKLVSFCLISISFIQGCKKEEPSAPEISISSPENKASYAPTEEVVLSVTCSDEENLLYTGYFVTASNGDTVFSETYYNNGKQSFLNTKLNTAANPLELGDYYFSVYAINEFNTSKSVSPFSIDLPQINGALATYAVLEHDKPASNIVNVQILNSNFTQLRIYSIDYQALVAPRFFAFGSKIYSSDRYNYWIDSFDKLSGKNRTKLYNLTNSHSTSAQFYRGDQLYIYNHDINNNIVGHSEAGGNTLTFPSQYSQPHSVYQINDRFLTNEKNAGTSILVDYNKSTGARIATLNIPFNIEIEGFYDLGDANRIYFITKKPSIPSSASIWYYNRSLNSISQLSVSLPSTPKNLNPIVIPDGANHKAWIFTNDGVYEHKFGDVINKITPTTTANTSLAYIDRYEYSKDNGLLLFHTSLDYHASYDVINDAFLNEFGYGEKVVLLKD